MLRLDKVIKQWKDAAALNDAPARRLKGRIDVFGSGFGFVHGVLL